MSGRKPKRICERCQQPKPWRRGHEPPEIEGVRRFVCEDCCRAAGGIWTPRNGWQFPLPLTK